MILGGDMVVAGIFIGMRCMYGIKLYAIGTRGKNTVVGSILIVW